MDNNVSTQRRQEHDVRLSNGGGGGGDVIFVVVVVVVVWGRRECALPYDGT